MKRKKVIYAAAIICIIAVAGVFFNERYYTLPHVRTEFRAYETAFESFKDFILSADLDLQDDESKIYGVVYDENRTIIGLHNFPIELGRKNLDSINDLDEMFTYHFDSIIISNKRISFNGSGIEMIVYSIDDKRPTYFFHEDDRGPFTVTKLSKHWYYLCRSIR